MHTNSLRAKNTESDSFPQVTLFHCVQPFYHRKRLHSNQWKKEIDTFIRKQINYEDTILTPTSQWSP